MRVVAPAVAQAAPVLLAGGLLDERDDERGEVEVAAPLGCVEGQPAAAVAPDRLGGDHVERRAGSRAHRLADGTDDLGEVDELPSAQLPVLLEVRMSPARTARSSGRRAVPFAGLSPPTGDYLLGGERRRPIKMRAASAHRVR